MVANGKIWVQTPKITKFWDFSGNLGLKKLKNYVILPKNDLKQPQLTFCRGEVARVLLEKKYGS